MMRKVIKHGEIKISYADCKILSIPLGPNVLLTKSPTAIAPTNADSRAFSPFSSVTSSANIWVGLANEVAYKLSVPCFCNTFLLNVKRTMM
jgi:hypothetical protein